MIAWIAAFLFAGLSCAAEEVRFRPLVLSGQPVPGAPGVTFDAGPANPSGGDTITRTGKFMAQAFTSSGIALIAGDVRAADPGIRVLIRNGAPAPGIAGPTVFAFGGRYAQAPDGRGVWGVTLDATAPAGTGYVFYGESAIGTPFIIARQGSPVPGLAGATFGNLNALETGPWVDGPGVFAFAAPIGTGTPADSAIWRGSLDAPGVLSLLARQGGAVPGQVAGTNYGDLRAAEPLVGPSGEVVTITNVVFGAASTQTLLYFPPGSSTPALVAQSGVPIAGITPGSFTTGQLTVNSAGQIAFSVTISSVPQGRVLLVGNPADPGSFRVAFSAGEAAPGLSPLTLVAPSSFRLGDDNRTTFVGGLAGIGVISSNDTAFYSETATIPALVWREGQANTLLPTGQFFSAVLSPHGRDGLGQSFALVSLGGTGVTSASDRAAIAIDRAGVPQIVAREGGLLELMPGDQRTMRQLDSAVWPQPPAVSEAGEFLLQVAFTNNTRAIMLGEMIACRADFNRDGDDALQDLFDFLAAWFGRQPRADVNGMDGVTVQDLFDFLAAWFGGCP